MFYSDHEQRSFGLGVRTANVVVFNMFLRLTSKPHRLHKDKLTSPSSTIFGMARSRIDHATGTS
jgi:hypothetical protein